MDSEAGAKRFPSQKKNNVEYRGSKNTYPTFLR